MYIFVKWLDLPQFFDALLRADMYKVHRSPAFLCQISDPHGRFFLGHRRMTFHPVSYVRAFPVLLFRVPKRPGYDMGILRVAA